MKATITFGKEEIEAVDMIDRVAEEFGGSSHVICPVDYRYHKVKVLILKEKVKENARTKYKK